MGYLESEEQDVEYDEENDQVTIDYEQSLMKIFFNSLASDETVAAGSSRRS